MTDLPYEHRVEIAHLVASPVHRLEGRPADGPRDEPGEPPSRRSVRIRAGLGIVGDRYFGQRAHRTAAVTVMSVEAVERVAEELGVDAGLDPVETRRNVLLRGAPVDALRGMRFSLDSGDGPVEFQGNRPANPCAWMDVMLAPGAFRALRGRGGVRCEPLGDGILTVGPAILRTERPLAGAPGEPAPRGATRGDATRDGARLF
ncbi:molybdenum cofactor biosysynthesis protein [Clavibacter tessellarius]|uniref:Molybdenum cofactor biosysynthesis protein n=1 Tax=Clavibacter tessellarius TaxID=31965 RepID=A0A225CK54_9MICO|nr:molybdenum cofactor biosysynthesis protein [Clavibacter michiganensis]OQJ62122.1 molybdenum cofactor biosysynthesis protein [Clavibacter michiganensis subsp. tessellarius]UKF34878.1 molybdenum cofactor biosysynthesis protein [Clavibacter michiganensis subsp. tessellarius]